jgi:hypothetical protein
MGAVMTSYRREPRKWRVVLNGRSWGVYERRANTPDRFRDTVRHPRASDGSGAPNERRANTPDRFREYGPSSARFER